MSKAVQPEQIVHALLRMADYGNTLSQDDRDLLRSASSAIRTPTDASNEVLASLSPLNGLIAILSDPKKYQPALDELTAQVQTAKDLRSTTINDAETAAAEAAQKYLAPREAELKTREQAAANTLAEAQTLMAQYDKAKHAAALILAKAS
jgi:hypothetical protein